MRSGATTRLRAAAADDGRGLDFNQQARIYQGLYPHNGRGGTALGGEFQLDTTVGRHVLQREVERLQADHVAQRNPAAATTARFQRAERDRVPSLSLMRPSPSHALRFSHLA